MIHDAKDRETLLAEASRSIRSAMQAQRQELAARLRSDPAGEAEFPRSFTVRLLMRHPVQASAWLGAVLRSRIGATLLAIVVLSLLLRAIRLAMTAPGPTAIGAPKRASDVVGAASPPR